MNKKVAIITGAATGIGRATALMLASQGVDIVINYSRSEREAREVKTEVEKLGVKALLYKADVSKDQQVRDMVKQTIEKLGRLDILVNNAGSTNFVNLEDLEGLKEEYWDRAMEVNAKGLFFASRAAAPELKKTRGTIVNVTSIAGICGVGSSIAYCASKAAAISVTKSLARVLAPEIRVNAVAPGVVETRWVEGKKEHVEKGLIGTPLGRVCQPEDVAEVIVSLINSASMLTGQIIVIDGGKTL